MDTSKRILLVDDEAEIINVLTFLLERDGYQISSASNGEEALEILSLQSFSAVICDLRMPKMDGLTFLKTVRAQHNLVSFIFLSGHANSKDELEMINYGVNVVIHKPELLKVPEALKNLLKDENEVESLKRIDSDETKEFINLLHSIDDEAC